MHASQRIRELFDTAKRPKTITLLYGAKDGERNEAVVLRSLFERMKK